MKWFNIRGKTQFSIKFKKKQPSDNLNLFNNRKAAKPGVISRTQGAPGYHVIPNPSCS